MTATRQVRVIPESRYVSRDSCGFCEGTHGQPAGVCRDAEGHCHGTWPRARPATADNPEGLWTCACFAADHPGRNVS
jgi:hypothetical protein